jgi:hypothetical protein
MRRYLILVAAIVIVLAVVFGCSDRGTNITTLDLGDLEGWPGVDPSPNHPFTPALTLQLKNPQEVLYGAAYWPPGANDIPPSHPLPLLILLAPENGNRFYYFKAGLGELVRELTASGQIQPMIIYCMANDQTFGGYFYGDSDPAGHYDSIFISDDTAWANGADIQPSQPVPDGGGPRDDLLQYLHTFYPATIRRPSKRGLGGIGQGAYGAFRIAIKNPGMFSSIAVADGPLDFDGAGGGGLISLFDDAVAEQEAFYDADPPVDTVEVSSSDIYDDILVDTIFSGVDTIIDTSWVKYDTIPFNFRRDFDTSMTMPISRMLTGAAFAFSPNDTYMSYRRIIDSVYYQGAYHYSMRVIIDSRTQIADSTLPGGGDSTTFIGGIVRRDSHSRNIDMDFHLPFDETGTLYQPVWDRWMANNLENMFEAAGSDPLQGVSMWFATNPHARWNYYEMTQSWMDFLRGKGHEIEEYRYSSYNDDPVVHDEYLIDILREMLIFHSNNFGK